MVFRRSHIPLPPARLMYLTAGNPDAEWFWESGKQTTNGILASLKQNGIDFSKFDYILDFGCGCGRVLIHMLGNSHANFYGTDYNKKLVRWCAQNLRGSYLTNGSLPPLGFPDGTFDFIYAWSVFTHFTEESHLLWLNELYSKLKPDSFFWFSYSGRNFVSQLTEAEKAAFSRNEIVVYDSERLGSNWCCSYYSDEYLKRLIAQTKFQLLDLIPNDKVGDQSFCLLKKKAEPNVKSLPPDN